MQESSNGAIHNGAWYNDSVPQHHLLVLSGLPKTTLAASRHESIVLTIPPIITNVRALKALGPLFGTKDHEQPGDRAAARALYYLYIQKHPTLWNEVIRAAETIANLNVALVAHDFIQHMINAEWQTLPDVEPSNRDLGLPSESWLLNECNVVGSLPSSGIQELATGKTVSTPLFQYLMQPMQTFSGLGDEQSAVWQVANAKHGVVKSFVRQVEAVLLPQDATWQEVIDSLGLVIARGPLGVTSRGAEIGTAKR